jgi:hypothetical protein
VATTFIFLFTYVAFPPDRAFDVDNVDVRVWGIL